MEGTEIKPSGTKNTSGERVLFSVGFNIKNTKDNQDLIKVYRDALSDIAEAFSKMPEYSGFANNVSNLTKGLIKYARDNLKEE